MDTQTIINKIEKIQDFIDEYEINDDLKEELNSKLDEVCDNIEELDDNSYDDED